MNVSVQPAWAARLPIQQQSVLFLAGRGPDGIAKAHDCKPIVVAYRACALVAAKYARQLTWGERGDDFMSMHIIAEHSAWEAHVNRWFQVEDELPHHYLMHFYHGAEILGFKHPDGRVRERWAAFYARAVAGMHVRGESEAEMDQRLGDWGRKDWHADAFAPSMVPRSAVEAIVGELRAKVDRIDHLVSGAPASVDDRMREQLNEAVGGPPGLKWQALLTNVQALRIIAGRVQDAERLADAADEVAAEDPEGYKDLRNALKEYRAGSGKMIALESTTALVTCARDVVEEWVNGHRADMGKRIGELQRSLAIFAANHKVGA